MAQACLSGRLGDTDESLVVGIIRQFGEGYEVFHDIRFWVVDKEGMMRVFLEADAALGGAPRLASGRPYGRIDDHAG
jgi:hypothetical protein